MSADRSNRVCWLKLARRHFPVLISMVRFGLAEALLLAVIAGTAISQASNPPPIVLTSSPETRELAPGAAGEASVALLAGQAVDVDLKQLSGEMQAQWRCGEGPESTPRTSGDGNHGHVRATIVAGQPCALHLSVTAIHVRPLRFTLVIGTPGEASEDDRERAAGGDAFARGEELRNKNARANAAAASSAYLEALEKFRHVKDACGIRGTLIGLAHIQIATQQYAEARASAEQALAQPCNDIASKAHSLRTIQSAVSRLGDLDAKISTGEDALALYRETGDEGLQGLVLGNLSGAWAQQGATGKALDAAQQALALARASGDQEGVLFDQETIGAIHLQRGDYQLALGDFNAVLDDVKLHPYPMVQAMAETNLGSAYSNLGDAEQAIAALGRAEATATAAGDFSVLADTYINEGAHRLGALQFSAAAKAFSRALDICIERQFARKKAGALRGLGASEVAEGHSDAGLKHLLEARSLAHSLHDDVNEIAADDSLGHYYLHTGDLAKAEEAFTSSRDLARDANMTSQSAIALASLARVDVARRDLRAAETNAQAALAIIEDQQSQVNEPDLRSEFFQSTRSYYDLYIHVLMGLEAETHDQRYARTALEAAENSRARALTDLLSERAIDIRNAVPADLLKQRSDARDALHAVAYRLTKLSKTASPRDRDALEASLAEARNHLDRVEGNIRTANRRYSDLTHPAPLTVEEIQRFLPADHTTVLEYWLSAEESYLWEVTPRSFQFYRLPGAKKLDTLANRLHGLLSSGPQLPAGVSLEQKGAFEKRKEAEIASVAGQLSNILLPGAAIRLRNLDLAIVADGDLRGLPFGLLPIHPSRTLEQENRITYLPSVETLRSLRADPAAISQPMRLAVFADPVFDSHDRRLSAKVGDPPAEGGALLQALRDAGHGQLSRLVWSRREAKAISALANDKAWMALDFDANRSAALRASWEPYAVAHFATHALINVHAPELSGIVLSLYDEKGNAVDGFLRVTDIYSLKMPVQLVVLSTCDSAADSAALGNDVYTLANSFFYAGAKRVLASLWSVDDQATAEFMSLFYQSLLRNHASPAEALRFARTAMKREPRWSSPYYWSGFVLEGDWQ